MTSAKLGTDRRPRPATGKFPVRRPHASSKRKRTSRQKPTSDPPIPSGADAPSFASRLSDWTDVLEPQNPVERYLVERAVHLSWQLDHEDGAPLDRPPATPTTTQTPAAVDAESADRRDRRQQARGRVLCRILDTFVGLRRLPAREIADAAPAKPLDPPRAPAAVERDAGPTSAPGPDASPRRRRRPGMRDRQPAWSGRDDRQGPRPIAADDKSRPDRRARSQAETSPDDPHPRRRVGGYAVPLDPAVPVSCADRIPVKLRREALATRLAR